MIINFEHQGKRYVNYDTESEAWSELEIDSRDKDNIIHQAQYDEAVSLRKKAYAAESDPLRNEWKYEEETGNPDADQYKQKWLDKVVEIKERIPLPQLVVQA
ncbi:hypothetical protein [Vibrio methylphosphonaticus]|uniref:hypothetical protein n=1 Tax=Vibrio methylphosphonaticus TaxID=2946866 RepID=UPI00202AA2AD|nr:hypothetical protein [Vibrio methylphosphonaticus]MCL9775697.1 hypothetical protein [Vibrio methylphosphonaticus]